MTFEEYYEIHYKHDDDIEFKKALERAWKTGHIQGFAKACEVHMKKQYKPTRSPYWPKGMKNDI